MAMNNGKNEEAQVTLEDQKKINEFARKNVRLNEIDSEISDIKKSLQNIEDGSDDLMMLEDDSEMISYQIGEAFFEHSSEDTQSMLESTKETLQREVEGLESKAEEIKSLMKGLKVQLYAKFGDTINLEA